MTLRPGVPEPKVGASEQPICDLVRVGVPLLRAARAHGVSEGTFEEWMRRGRVGGRGNHYHQKFRNAVLKAEAECERDLVRVLRSGEKGWQAAALMLERRFPERWVRRSVSGEQSDRADGRPAGGGNPFEDLDNVVPIQRKDKR